MNPTGWWLPIGIVALAACLILAAGAGATEWSGWARWGPAAIVAALIAAGASLSRRRESRLLALRRGLDLADGEVVEHQLPASAPDADRTLAAAIDRRLQQAWRATDDLENERRLLSSVLDEMKVALLLLGDDVKLQRANTTARRLFEVEGDIRGQALSSMIRAPEVLSAVDEVIKGGTAHAVVPWRGGPGGRQFEVQLNRLGEGASPLPRTGVLILLYEITRLERLEAVRRDFVANVSHELRTPLTSIQAAIETLTETPLSPTQSEHFLQIIARQSQRMADLVEDLTDLSQIETGAIELSVDDVDAHRVVREICDQLTPLAERLDVRLDNRLESPFTIQADRRRVEQMLTNLIHNAIKFNREGRCVCIEGSHGERYTSLAVRDEGTGIPYDAQQRIFNRFYQVEQARSREIGGTGLGLAIVKHLMRLHGGRIRLDSELGKGSTFYLDFPPAGADPDPPLPLD